jgi:hypothetical protein
LEATPVVELDACPKIRETLAELEERREDSTEGDSDEAAVDTEGQFLSDSDPPRTPSCSEAGNTFERKSSSEGSKSRWRCFCASEARWPPTGAFFENSSLSNERFARSCSKACFREACIEEIV